jgi:hypothetical protein
MFDGEIDDKWEKHERKTNESSLMGKEYNFMGHAN